MVYVFAKMKFLGNFREEIFQIQAPTLKQKVAVELEYFASVQSTMSLS